MNTVYIILYIILYKMNAVYIILYKILYKMNTVYEAPSPTQVFLPRGAVRVLLWSGRTGPRPDRGLGPGATTPSWSYRNKGGGKYGNVDNVCTYVHIPTNTLRHCTMLEYIKQVSHIYTVEMYIRMYKTMYVRMYIHSQSYTL